MVLLGGDENMKGVKRWCEGMRMAGLEEEVVVEGLRELVEVEKDWVGKEKGR